MVKDDHIDVVLCAERVRAVQKALFGSTLGNKYRQHIQRVRQADDDGLKRLARNTYGAIIDAVFSDSVLAPYSISQLTRQRDHGAVIFIALDLANLSLMNPQISDPATHRQWVKDIATTFDKPVAMILRCVEWLKN